MNGYQDDEACMVTTALDCALSGGTYQGDGTMCLGMVACCKKDGSCEDMDEVYETAQVGRRECKG